MINTFFSHYPKQVKLLSFVALLILAGFSFMWPLTSIYVTSILGKSLTTAGWVLAAEGMAGVIGSFLGGIFFDRIGGKYVMLFASFLVILCNIFLAFSKEWIIFLSAFVLMNISVGMIMTSISALTGLIWPEGGKKPFNLNYVFQNVGVAFGTAFGGFVSSFSFSYSFVTNAVFFCLAAIIMIFGLKNVKSKKNSTHIKLSTSKKGTLRTFLAISMLGLGASFTMVSYIQWQTSIPVFMNHLDFSLSSYSFLWTLNGILVIMLQPLNALIGKLLPSNRLQFLCGQICFIISFLILLINQNYFTFIVAMGFVTLAEVIIWPAIPAVASQISPNGRDGMFQGVISVFNYSGRLMGPIIGTALFDEKGPFTMLSVMIAFYVIALINFLMSFSFRTFGVQKSLKNKKLIAGEQ